MYISSTYRPVQLATHVRACRVDDQMIFLDLLRNRYIGMGGPRLAELSMAVLGDPQAEVEGTDLPGTALSDDWVRRLRDQQLLSDKPPARLVRKMPNLPEVVIGIDEDDDDRSPVVDWHVLARLWRAKFVASVWLRRHSLAEIADRVVALRSRRDNQESAIDADAMHAAAASYAHLRPFALTTHDRCLNDSLTLIHFLAARGLFPHWVIGVRIHPFGAHSWVQSGGIVLNDLPERVRRYRPILVV